MALVLQADDPFFTVVAANNIYLNIRSRTLEDVVGKSIFALLDSDSAEYVAEFTGSLKKVIATGDRDRLTPERPPTGDRGVNRGVNAKESVERVALSWINSPVLGATGQVEFILHAALELNPGIGAFTSKQESGMQRERDIHDSARLESLGVMAGGIAHDFNNLLTGILMNATMLKKAEREEDAAIAGEIVMAAERAAELTRHMFAFAGKSVFQTEVLDLNLLVQENLTLLRASLSRNAIIRLSLDCDASWVKADRAHMQMIVMNLVLNASDALGAHTGEVEIRTALMNRAETTVSQRLQSVLPAGPYVLLEVRDNGCGMTAATIKRIFSPFFTTKVTGKGLGLAAILGIIKEHKGDIEVESKPGVGTIFRILLPQSAYGPVPEQEKRESKMLEGAGRVVLVVDDEDTIRRVATIALERAGFRVIIAANGQEGMEALRNHPDVSIVILDLTMPVMNGNEALPLIRRNYPALPIVLSSGYTEAEVARQAPTAGVTEFLQKPYGASTLVSKISRVLHSMAR